MWLDEETARNSLVDIGRWVGSRGWCPATSGNLSCRAGEESFLISVSGKDKGSLQPEDFLAVDFLGKPINSSKRPSAETLLHAVIYSLFPDARFVVHTHSVNGTVLSRHLGKGEIVFRDYELQKAFSGVETHSLDLTVPLFANSQDMDALAVEVRGVLTTLTLAPAFVAPAFVLAGHGVYTWGKTAPEARRHAEAMEILMECEYQSRLLR